MCACCRIVADASSYATGKVRVDCIAGLKRLSALRAAPWARLADDLGLYPTPHMLHLVDKKFGGELTKADVFGVEVRHSSHIWHNQQALDACRQRLTYSESGHGATDIYLCLT